ncbi:MAG: hypothetical protein KDK37_13475, partial [Leptospiraceae bacterium]|nr:hypothetical protein [Leptospiraceae bacterium]
MSRCIFRNRIFFLSLILIVYGLYGWARSQRFGGPTALIGFGCIQGTVCFADLNRPFLPNGAAVFPTGGYDGQFYYYTAVSLYSHVQLAELADSEVGKSTEKKVYVDSLPFRLPRIGFPLLSGWLYWLGPKALALGMPLFLLFVHLIASYVLFRFRPATGWIVGLNPISLLSFGLNLAEPIAISFTAVAVVLFLKKAHWPWLAATLACLAFLSKETMFICGFSLGLALLYRIY